VWAPEPLWTLGDERNSFTLAGIQSKFMGRPACSLGTVPTEV
jgi:hypothetical protein